MDVGGGFPAVGGEEEVDGLVGERGCGGEVVVDDLASGSSAVWEKRLAGCIYVVVCAFLCHEESRSLECASRSRPINTIPLCSHIPLSHQHPSWMLSFTDRLSIQSIQ